MYFYYLHREINLAVSSLIPSNFVKGKYGGQRKTYLQKNPQKTYKFVRFFYVKIFNYKR